MMKMFSTNYKGRVDISFFLYQLETQVFRRKASGGDTNTAQFAIGITILMAILYFKVLIKHKLHLIEGPIKYPHKARTHLKCKNKYDGTDNSVKVLKRLFY